VAGTPASETADRLIRRVVRSSLLSLAVLTGVWTTALVIVGGIEINLVGTRITSHDGRRTLLYTSLLLSGYILAGGTFGLFRQLGRGIRSRVTRASWWQMTPTRWKPARLPAVIAVVASCLLLRQWASAQTMWLDEEMIALNLRDHRLAELPGLLWLGQSAPLGWLVIQRGMLVAFGTGELALRFVPVICGIATLITAVWVGRRWMSPVGATILTLLCALGYWFAHYFVESKQYSSDTFWALLLPALAAAAVEPAVPARARLRRIAAWWAAATVGQWLSIGGLLVIPGCALALLASVLFRDGWRAALKAAVPGIGFLIVFALHYSWSLRQAAESEYLRFYWSPGMPPASAGIIDTLSWLAGRLQPLAITPGGAESGAAFWVAAAIGLAVFGKRSGLGVFFGLVVVSGFVWAAFRLVPLAERVSLWMMPAVYVGIALCVDGAMQTARRAYVASQWPVFGIAALIGVVGLDASVEVFRGARGLVTGRPASNHELDDRTAVRWLMAQRHPGDAVMATHFGLPALWWYGDIPVGPLVGGGSRVPDGGAVLELSYRGQPCEPGQFRDALKDQRRLLVYLGFRFDDVPMGFDDLLWQRLRELGSVPIYRQFAERSRVLILDRRPEAPASVERAYAPASVEAPSRLNGCLHVQPARRD
jgi:hypothetical protein